MAYARINNGDATLNYLGLKVHAPSFFVCDELKDVATIKYDDNICPVGSLALILGYKEGQDTFQNTDYVNEGGAENASQTYMMSPSHKWVRFVGVTQINA